MTAPRALWSPTAERRRASQLYRFMQHVGLDPEQAEFADLHRFSIREPDTFWLAVWDFCALRGKRPTRVLEGSGMPGARWCTDARLNFAENLLSRSTAEEAIIFRNEAGERRQLTWAELAEHVAGVAAALRAAGVGPGDRVAALLPNLPETVVAMLASAGIGAIWSSCSPDFGLQGIMDRFGQISPKVLIGVDGYIYNGRRIDCLERLAAVAAALPSVQQVYVVPYLDTRPAPVAVPGAAPFPAPLPGAAPDFTALPFDHPLYILYTSGTTGLPKSIVHSAGGTLLQHRKEHVLHTDMRPGQRVFYFTTCGWMMWNWLVSALASECTIVLYDGSPFFPDPGILWRLAEEEGVAVFGTSAKYLSALEKSGYHVRDNHQLGKLRSILSTGSPLPVSGFEFVYQCIAADVQLASISGGTDIVSCFTLGNPMLPVFAGELQCLGLGMDVRVCDEAGAALIGERGELVCGAPFPSMPLGFWNDADGSRYRAAYFERFPGLWYHGDYAIQTPRGGIIMLGRSDTVLNSGGVRIGTAEIYRIVEQLPEIAEAIVVAQAWEDDTRIVLFVRPAPGVGLSAELEQKICHVLRSQGCLRHVPAKICAVTDIPRTLSGKIVEVAVREVMHGRPVENLDALANPEALAQFRDRPELQH